MSLIQRSLLCGGGMMARLELTDEQWNVLADL
ncbi:MAG: hypothetical protein JWP20_2251, partial [Roseomonas sp.]|nr:hypothetical protein [Roseomonas sp.]